MSDQSQSQLRPATREDASALAILMTQLGYPTAPAEMAVRLDAILADDDYYTLVAERDGNVVGMVGARVGVLYELGGPYGQIMVMVVDEQARGQGIGALLLHGAEEWLRGRGVGLIVLNSGLKRTAAHRFYQREGYTAKSYGFAKKLNGENIPMS